MSIVTLTDSLFTGRILFSNVVCIYGNGLPDYGELLKRAPSRIPDAMRTWEYQEELRKVSLALELWIEVHNSFIESLIKLLLRPWWRRVWVLQEVILVKKVSLYCGSMLVDWTFF